MLQRSRCKVHSEHDFPPLLCGSHTHFVVLVICPSLVQGGLTDLWLDDPYVVAAKKLIAWATEENEAGKVFPVSVFVCQIAQLHNQQRLAHTQHIRLTSARSYLLFSYNVQKYHVYTVPL